MNKELPQDDTIIGVNNVNGGVTSITLEEGNIIIFRKQEWLKVLIHELIHFFELDFANEDQEEIKQKMFKLFPIKSKFNLFESWTEVWAELINISLIAYCYKDNYKEYLLMLEELIAFEIFYSKFQLLKILSYNKIKFEDLFKKFNKYQEGSNIFSYYIIKYLHLHFISIEFYI